MMKLLSATPLSGCNVHHRSPVIRLEVDLGALTGLVSTAAGPAFADRFVQRFENLRTCEPSPADGLPDEFVRRLHSSEGAPFADVLLQAILAVERSLASHMNRPRDVEFARAEPGASPRRIHLIWPCRVPGLSRRAARVGVVGLDEILPDTLRAATDGKVSRFEVAEISARRWARKRRLSPAAALVARAAEQRGVPWESSGGPYLLLGEGRNQRRLWGSVPETTPFLACRLARDEQRAKRILADAGLPLVEGRADGESHRLLVIGGRLVAAAKRSAAVESAIDVTDRVHPENRKMAVRAAEAFGLDVAGIDFLTSDIRFSYRDTGGILQVDSRPDFRLHTGPATGESRDVVGALVEALCPSTAAAGRLPVAVIVGERRRRVVARTLERLLRRGGKKVGLVHGRDAHVAGERVGPSGGTRRSALRAALRDERTEVLVRTTSAGEIVRCGLRQDLCDVAAIFEESSDRAALDVLARGSETLVVGVENPPAMDAVSGIDPDRVVLVAPSARRIAVRRHLDAGGRVVMWTKRGDCIAVTLVAGPRTVLSYPIPSAPASKLTRADIEPHLFALALVSGLSLSADDLRTVCRKARGKKRVRAPESRPVPEQGRPNSAPLATRSPGPNSRRVDRRVEPRGADGDGSRRAPAPESGTG